MGDQELSESQPMRGVRDGIGDEVVRLLKLVRRLENENMQLRRALMEARPIAV
jgi:hypothetical protein